LVFVFVFNYLKLFVLFFYKEKKNKQILLFYMKKKRGGGGGGELSFTLRKTLRITMFMSM